jgi:hypothetical protein
MISLCASLEPRVLETLLRAKGLKAYNDPDVWSQELVQSLLFQMKVFEFSNPLLAYDISRL